MGLMDKVTSGLERAAQEADKAFEKGKTKVGELQVEMQMDGLAKKLGYIVFDFYRGREIDQALRQKYLDEMAGLEERLMQLRAEAEAKKAAAKAQAAPEAAPAAEATTEAAAAASEDAAAEADSAVADIPVPPMGE